MSAPEAQHSALQEVEDRHTQRPQSPYDLETEVRQSSKSRLALIFNGVSDLLFLIGGERLFSHFDDEEKLTLEWLTDSFTQVTGRPAADYLHYWPWEHPDGGASHESGGNQFSDQAAPHSGPSGCDSGSDSLRPSPQGAAHGTLKPT